MYGFDEYEMTTNQVWLKRIWNSNSWKEIFVFNYHFQSCENDYHEKIDLKMITLWWNHNCIKKTWTTKMKGLFINFRKPMESWMLKITSWGVKITRRWKRHACMYHLLPLCWFEVMTYEAFAPSLSVKRFPNKF
jgi:hypothetical protein